MNVNTEAQPDATSVFIWFGRPDVGRPYVLMVAVNSNERGGIVYRPLIYLTRDQADGKGRELAEGAARDLGVDVELHEYQVVQVLDRVGAGQ